MDGDQSGCFTIAKSSFNLGDLENNPNGNQVVWNLYRSFFFFFWKRKKKPICYELPVKGYKDLRIILIDSAIFMLYSLSSLQ